MATRLRHLESLDTGTAKATFKSDPSVAALSSVLTSLGYNWELILTDERRNRYDVRLEKGSVRFLLSTASSGERELLTYLFAVYGLNVRDALVVIDEPELHLHPRWQALLISLFERLAEDTGNQFVMATHSPSFVVPDTLPYLTRVYSDNEASRLVKLDTTPLPTPRHLFAIINSQNNERIFFADTVVLVEGTGDLLFYQRLLEREGVEALKTGRMELVAVGGKGNFPRYVDVLTAAKVRYGIIADLDYVSNTGDSSVKNLFEVNPRAIADDVIDNPKSLDGEALVGAIEAAVYSSDRAQLVELWEHIKERKRRRRPELTDGERQTLEEFLLRAKASGTFILSRGALENYLPLGLHRKDIDRLISHLEGNWWDITPPETQEELRELGRWAAAL